MEEPKSAVDVIGRPRIQRWPSRAGALGAPGLIGLLMWLWPFGLGGGMPVGGDVTQFFLGLMSVLSTSLGEHRLPAWNEFGGTASRGSARARWGVFYLLTCFCTDASALNGLTWPAWCSIHCGEGSA